MAGGRQGQAGAKPLFSDSEVITLLLLMACLPFPGETQFLGFVRANHRSLFPHLLSQSQFNRRARQLWPWVEALRRHWAEVLGATRASLYLLDTKPRPVVGYMRRKDRSDFAATADYGVCARRNLKYFGYKLILLCTPAGVPAAYELVPASTDERVAGEQVLDWVWQARILGDKGFIGVDWQQGYRETRGLDILTPARQPAHGPACRLPAVAQSSAGADRRRLPRSPEHRPPPGASDLQDAPGLEHPCRGQDSQPCPQAPAPPSGRD